MSATALDAYTLSRASVPPALYEAVWRRHSGRFPFSDRALPTTVVTELRAAARADGAHLDLVSPADADPLLRLIGQAEHRDKADTDRAAESRRWVRASGRAADGPTGCARVRLSNTSCWWPPRTACEPYGPEGPPSPRLPVPTPWRAS
ncbi:hypothetical protein [Streptomyces sp. NPDC001833]|uniref:hypothetical protein n=1 Tax=Streptomyces sp. NPDC001833 TaxID=3154658 RepID=UPI00332C65D7